MINILLNGCAGRMGRAVTDAAAQTDGARVVCGADLFPAERGYPVYAKISDCRETADVIVDFSNPASQADLLAYALARKLPCVVCTTGLAQKQIDALREAAKQIPVFFSANMSLGVNLLIELASRAAKLLEGSFDIEIIEKHHNQKLDAPSGTALAIADAISESLKTPAEYVYDRHSVRKKRSPSEIGIHAVRGGTIVGEHEILFAGKDETLNLAHSAASREVFATGAVRAAFFLAKQKPGLYSMKDLVNALIQ
jgi:4-hydroxy-tetrahydrodipicolinate reductase